MNCENAACLFACTSHEAERKENLGLVPDFGEAHKEIKENR